MNRTLVAAAQFSISRLLGIALLIANGIVGASMPARGDSPRRDVRLIGLGPLYEALFAVANCPNVALDEPAFRRATRLYQLTPNDLTSDGAFAPEIAELTADYRVRLGDDRSAFCDARRLQFAGPRGVLIDLGPELLGKSAVTVPP